MGKKIAVIGSLAVDCVARMARFPRPGETVVGTSIAFSPGGKGANQCVAIARLGGEVSMIGAVGRDANGVMYRNLLVKEGIDVRGLLTADAPTGTAQILINDEGENSICVIPGANHAFDLSCLEQVRGLIDEADAVVLQLELRRDVTEAILCYAHDRKKTVVLNPAPAMQLSKQALSAVDFLTPNETELALLSGETDRDRAFQTLLGLGVSHIVATFGAEGVVIADANGVRKIPAFPVRVVDTVAAGDSFTGALTVALCEGRSLDEAALFGNAMGALTVGCEGAIPSLHRRDEVIAFLRERGIGMF